MLHAYLMKIYVCIVVHGSGLLSSNHPPYLAAIQELTKVADYYPVVGSLSQLFEWKLFKVVN